VSTLLALRLSPATPVPPAAAVLGAAVVALLVVHEWRQITSRPPFSAPL
jgi:glucose uptake protein GlcU